MISAGDRSGVGGDVALGVDDAIRQGAVVPAHRDGADPDEDRLPEKDAVYLATLSGGGEAALDGL